MKAIQGGGEEEQSAEESLVQAARDKPEGRCEKKKGLKSSEHTLSLKSI